MFNMWNSIAGYSIICLLILVHSGCTSESLDPQKEILYVGTFSDEGLYVLEFNREERSFSELQRVDDHPEPNFQALHPNGAYLYSVSRAGEYGSISSYSINSEDGSLSFINEQLEETRGQNHISIDPQGRFAYVANGGVGTISVYPITSGGQLGEAVDVVQHEGSSVHDRQGGPYPHSNTPSMDGNYVYTPDLGTDQVAIYALDSGTGQLTPAQMPYVELEPGSGPRHFAIHPEGNFAYSVNELASTVSAFAVDQTTGALEKLQRINMLPDDFDEFSHSAEIQVSPDGRFLYASNRGHDSLVIYEIDQSTGQIELVGHESTRGGHPRNFAVDALGEFVFVVNRDDNNVVLFERDQETGLLTYTGVEAEVDRPICITQYFIY